MNLLNQLKIQSKLVTDSGNIEFVKRFKPVDATANFSLICSAAQDPKYAGLINDAITFALYRSTDKHSQLNMALDRLLIGYSLRILNIVPGRVSTEIDARLAYDTQGIIKKAQRLIGYFDNAGIDRSRILIKIISTWEGIKAAEILAREGIHCNMSLLLSMPQAIACADAGVRLISPDVGQIQDWYMKNNGDSKNTGQQNEPGVMLVRDINDYYRKFGYNTEIMPTNFRNIGEIIELVSCDLLAISPALLSQLELREKRIRRKLSPEKVVATDLKKADLDEKKFWWLMNDDEMASQKLAEGIKKLTHDIIKLERLLEIKLQRKPTKPVPIL